MSNWLDSINIAPEFGLIETQIYLDQINDRKDLFERYWEICYQSKKWVKWVGKDFVPTKQKESLIKMCGHYGLSNNAFNNDIKRELEGIDQLIQTNIINKLTTLHQ